jgi:hypothetical protein
VHPLGPIRKVHRRPFPAVLLVALASPGPSVLSKIRIARWLNQPCARHQGTRVSAEWARASRTLVRILRMGFMLSCYVKHYGTTQPPSSK